MTTRCVLLVSLPIPLSFFFPLIGGQLDTHTSSKTFKMFSPGGSTQTQTQTRFHLNHSHETLLSPSPSHPFTRHLLPQFSLCFSLTSVVAAVDERQRKVDTGTLAQKIAALAKPMEQAVTVEVKLVGFDGDGYLGVTLGERDFAPYLEALRADVHAHVLRSAGGGGGGGDDATADEHTMPIKTQFYFHVTKASRRLNGEIQSAVRGAVTAASEADGGAGDLAVIPHDLTEDVVRADYMKSSIAYTLYILNPDSPGRPYVYSYDSARYGGGGKGSSGGGVGGGMNVKGGRGAWAGGSGCPGTLWVSKEHYAWVDLTAGPVSYGPRTSGEGLVWESLPRVTDVHRRRPASLVVPLVGLLRRACALLFSPPMDHGPVEHWDDTRVNVVRITDLPKGNADHSAPLGLDAIEEALRSAVLPGQTVSVAEREVGVGGCSFCVAAMHRALKAAAHVSAPHPALSAATTTATTATNDEDGVGVSGGGGGGAGGGAGGGVSGRYHEYLDVSELHYWMGAFRERISAETGIDLGAPGTGETRKVAVGGGGGLSKGGNVNGDGEGRRVRAVPVFLFDLVRTEPLLLDRRHQAVAFPDMVLAVRTRSPAAAVDLQCDGKVALTEPADLHRPLLAGVLQSGWGVAPTHLSWGEPQNRSVADHLFSVGNTPFGHLAAAAGPSLAFPQADAVKRHVILSQVNKTIADAGKLLRAVEKMADGEALLPPEDHEEYGGRWASLLFKQERALAAAAMHDYAKALHFALSARHDLAAASRLMSAAARKLDARLECFEDAPVALGMVAWVVGGIAAAALAVVKGRSVIMPWYNIRVAKQF